MGTARTPRADRRLGRIGLSRFRFRRRAMPHFGVERSARGPVKGVAARHRAEQRITPLRATTPQRTTPSARSDPRATPKPSHPERPHDSVVALLAYRRLACAGGSIPRTSANDSRFPRRSQTQESR